jgi:hypothetical protein
MLGWEVEQGVALAGGGDWEAVTTWGFTAIRFK